jgi:hypothetical protein
MPADEATRAHTSLRSAPPVRLAMPVMSAMNRGEARAEELAGTDQKFYPGETLPLLGEVGRAG